MDWSSLLSALLGGLIALSGQWVQAALSRRSEVLRRSETAAVGIRDALHRLEGLYRTHVDAEGQDLTVAGDRERDDALRRIRSEALLIADPEVRDRVLFIARALADPYGIRDWAGDLERRSTWRLCRWAEEVLGAYLRREKTPPEPAYVETYRGALEDADDAREQQRQDELAWRREQQALPRQESAPTVDPD
jgi:hypothetical protein